MEGAEGIRQQILGIAEDVAEIKHGMKNVQQSQNMSSERQARLDERQQTHTAAIERAFTSLTDHEGRLKQIELEQPMTKWVRGLVLSGLLAMVAAGGFGAWVVAKVADRPIQIQLNKD